MSDFNTEQKQQLVQQIRRQYYRNQYDMQNREQIMYHYPNNAFIKDYSSNIKEISTLKVRILSTVILVMLIISMDILNISLMGLDMEMLFRIISKNNIVK